jgi:hypothetical protein
MDGTSLITSDVTDIISDFAGDLVPTVIGLLTIIVPVGLSLWAIGFGVKKALNYLQRSAKKSI